MNIAVFASGFGSNLQAVINAVKSGKIKASLRLVVSDVPGCYALKRAKRAGIETLVQEAKNFSDRTAYDKAIVRQLKKRKINLVVLAGFMRIISPYFVRSYKNKIINIHPALLPSFKGTHGIRDAFRYGVKVTGPTVHFVDEKMDHGPIILQEAVSVKENDTEKTLAKRIHKAEHKVYPLAIRLFAEKKIKVSGRKVKISSK